MYYLPDPEALAEKDVEQREIHDLARGLAAL